MHPHIETLHLHPSASDLSLVPDRYRSKILGIFEQYTTGYRRLEGTDWVVTEPN
jgi:hypothetical protein